MMTETDFWLMTLVVFIPSAFALGLVFFPKGTEEAMRWWSLFGTALTLGVSLVMFVGFKDNVVDRYTTTSNPMTRADGSLAARVAKDEGTGHVHDSQDWVARYEWIPRFNIDYFLGVDGVSMPLILLTTALTFLSMIASWGITKFVRGYCMLFLILETGMLGTFLALDFFLFYIFWEVMLLPMYFLIGVWGGPRREYAAIKFFLYTLLGSVFILIALLAFYFTDVRDFVPQERVVELKNQGRAEMESQVKAEHPDWSGAEVKRVADERLDQQVVINTFDLVLLQKVGKAALFKLDGKPVENEGIKAAQARLAAASAGPEADAARRALERAQARLDQWFFQPWFQYTMFIFLFIGFAIKVPVFPFHTWLPDAHVEAPTPISMILAGVLLKLGGYGIIRVCYPICPWAAEHLAYGIALFGVINIVYGAFAAMAQTDFKKLVAYSSISHMGYVILGVAVWAAPGRSQYWSWGMNGAMFQMIAHGITSAGMFFLVGVIYDRAHHRNLDNFRGLYEPMPLYGGLSAIIFFAAMGLPGMCGFVGEFMVVVATWEFNKVFAVLAAATVVLTAAYILWTVQRVFMGENPQYKNYRDITPRELACIVPLVVLCVLFGIFPALILNWMEPSVTHLIDTLASVKP
jgi:NADH-quinone oxidoreductase subunit M